MLHRVRSRLFRGWWVSLLLLAACGSVANERVSLSDIISIYGFKPRGVNGATPALNTVYTRLRLGRDSRRLDYNGTCLWLNGLAMFDHGEWTLSAADRDAVLDPILRMPQTLERAPRAQVVVLDPGHGGEDPGAVASTGAEEKDVTLDVALKVRDLLQHSGLEVHVTRDSDTSRTLMGRAAFARQVGADLFVSIHANTAANSAAQGIETFAVTPAGYASTGSQIPSATTFPGNRYDAPGFALAYLVHRGVLARSAPSVDRGVKHARFEVLRGAPCPAALVELGFLSNSKERSRLATPSWRMKQAEGITHGILTYCSRSQRAHRK